MVAFNTDSPEATSLLGKQLATVLKDGDVLCLVGDLGAGKTLLVKAIAAGMGIEDEVTSPTFNVLNIYDGTVTLYHFDLYRLDTQEELEDIGFDEYTHSGGVVLIEWPDKFIREMPDERLWLEIEKITECDRRITVKPIGSRYQTICKELEKVVSSRL